MSELKAVHAFDVYEAYTKTGDDDAAQVYLKSEANKVIAHYKYKRCLAMARIAQDDWHLHNSFYAMGLQEFEKRKCEFYEKWRQRWLAIANKFKEAK